MEEMSVNRGAKFLSVIYNWLGLIGITALVYTGQSTFGQHGINFRVIGLNHMIVLILTIAFFYTSYLLLSKNKLGLLLPIFGLTFLMTGGYVILLPILIGHLFFVNMSSVQKYFV